MLCWPTLSRVLPSPTSQPPAPRQPAAVYLTKALVYFYLLDCPCTLLLFFRADSRARGSLPGLAPLPHSRDWAGLTNSYLFCLLTSLSVVEGKAGMRKWVGGWGGSAVSPGIREREGSMRGIEMTSWHWAHPPKAPASAPKPSTAPRLPSHSLLQPGYTTQTLPGPHFLSVPHSPTSPSLPPGH